VTVKVNLMYVLIAAGAVVAAIVALQQPEARRYLKMETM
jgi:hypothetical protein